MKKFITFLSIGVLLITVSCQKQIDRPAELPQSNQKKEFSLEAYQAKMVAHIKAEVESLNKLSARLLEKSKTMTGVAKKPPRGTIINVPGDYATIQEAVDNAPDRATINVTGDHTENLFISERNNITIDGGGTAMLTASSNDIFAIAIFSSSSIIIKGFTILDGPVDAVGSQQIEISNNDISGKGDGIRLNVSSNCTLKNNTVHDNYYDDVNGGAAGNGNGNGILLLQSNQNTITNNHTNNNAEFGMVIIGSSSNTVPNNVLTNDGEGGILIQSVTVEEINYVSNSNNLQMNEISGTSVGINLFGGVSNNVLKNNQSLNNSNYGVILGGGEFEYPSGNKISSCNFSNNGNSGVNVLSYATNNLFTSVTASNNSYYGFNLRIGSTNNTVKNCKATGNGTCDYWDQGTNNSSVHNNFGQICN